MTRLHNLEIPTMLTPAPKPPDIGIHQIVTEYYARGQCICALCCCQYYHGNAHVYLLTIPRTFLTMHPLTFFYAMSPVLCVTYRIEFDR